MLANKKIIAAVLAVLAALLIGLGVWLVPYSKNVAEQESAPVTSIECWIYSKPLMEWIEQFQERNPQYHVETRLFRSSEQLYEELSAAISANVAPQLAEVGGLYGIPQLAESGMLVNLDERIAPEFWHELHPAFVLPFVYNQVHWALPLGGEVPVLYYNKNMFELAAMNESFITDPSRMLQAAAILTNDSKGSGNIENWGLAIDRDVPWYLTNWANSAHGSDGASRWAYTFRYWHELVFGQQQVMKQLQHHMAASDFINGKVGLFASSSNKMPLLTQYIGGKFTFDLLPLPLFGAANRDPHYLPRANGFVVLQSDADKEQVSLRLLEFMISLEVQKQLLLQSGKLPVLNAAADQMAEDNPSPEWETILQMRNQLVEFAPDGQESGRWQQLISITEQLELIHDIELDPLVDELLSSKP